LALDLADYRVEGRIPAAALTTSKVEQTVTALELPYEQIANDPPFEHLLHQRVGAEAVLRCHSSLLPRKHRVLLSKLRGVFNLLQTIQRQYENPVNLLPRAVQELLHRLSDDG